MTEETNSQRNQQQHLMLHMETNRVSAPHFSGGNDSEDPLFFLDEFKETVLESAKLWYREEFVHARHTKFDDGTNNCFVSQFPDEFVTSRWKERYRIDYRQRIQVSNKRGSEYMSSKVALAHRYEKASKTTIEIHDKIHDIISGLQLEYRDQIRETLETMKELRRQLSLMERNMNVIRMTVGLGNIPQPRQQHLAVRNQSESQQQHIASVNYNRHDRNHNNREINRNMHYHQQQAEEKLENHLTNALDRMESMFKAYMKALSPNAGSQQIPREILRRPNRSNNNNNNSNSNYEIRCYNCHGTSHMAGACTLPYRTYGSSTHRSNTCSARVQTNEVAPININTNDISQLDQSDFPQG
ncbi:hypothetical protein INT45_010714 [Circinella minor]|uniref:Uncharacterized protein n=1 Tax=Circinella minor TaxID=1195481 RepID=A0A8H7RR63_9FUNG|nr:hypothetical protein INT45_010714 [Circinella minor]